MDTSMRHWLMLRMIPRYGEYRISVTEIHSKLASEYQIHVDIRTIQRNLVDLQNIGRFQIESDGKKPAGWRWRENAPVISLPNMDPVTALTFKLVERYIVRMLPHGVLPVLQPYLTEATGQLSRNPESPLSRWPEKVRVMSRNLTTQPPCVSPTISAQVFTALLEEKQFSATYKTIGRGTKTYQVNPLGITFVDSLTYLIASLNNHTDPVLLLLHRIESVTTSAIPVTVPADFNLDECNAELLTFQVDDAITIKLRLSHKDDVERLKESPLAAGQKIKLRDDGSHELTATVEDTMQLRWWLKGFGARVEVLAPEKLRQEFVELARSYGEMYL